MKIIKKLIYRLALFELILFSRNKIIFGISIKLIELLILAGLTFYYILAPILQTSQSRISLQKILELIKWNYQLDTLNFIRFIVNSIKYNP
jgi:hypothetical protein